MSTDSTTDLLRVLVATLVQPEADAEAIAALLADAGYENPREHVSDPVQGRRGVYFPPLPGAEIEVARLQEAFGPGRKHLPLDSDGPVEWACDIAASETEHVVLSAELDDREVTVRQLRLTPYSL
jgi:hypothetical protein